MRRVLLLTLVFCSLSASFVSAQSDPAPAITHGPLSGEVSAATVMLWARGNQPGTLTFTVDDDPALADPLTVSRAISAEADFTGEVYIEGLNPATTYYFAVVLANEAGSASDPASGQFTTAPAPDNAAAFDFAFGACLGGQGLCRTPEAGYPIFNALLAEEPDFFLITGDTVYADNPCPVESNVPGADFAARTYDEFAARYRYNLEDPAYAAFLAQTPVFATWDDHEVVDNFGGQDLQRWNPDLFFAGRQAFFDYWPLEMLVMDAQLPEMYRSFRYGAQAEFFILDTRSYRDPLVNWDPSPVTGEPKTMLGPSQFAWLTQGLAASDATWHFIVSSVPLAYPTGWPQPQVDGRDSWANGPDRSGYETELMALLFFIEAHDIENVVFLTGDIHWPAALSYDPDRDGTPDFYEFSSSPLNALPLAPAAPDQTFNPTVLYAEGEFGGDLYNVGRVAIGEDGALTFRVLDRDGAERYSLTIQPQ